MSSIPTDGHGDNLRGIGDNPISARQTSPSIASGDWAAMPATDTSPSSRWSIASHPHAAAAPPDAGNSRAVPPTIARAPGSPAVAVMPEPVTPAQSTLPPGNPIFAPPPAANNQVEAAMSGTQPNISVPLPGTTPPVPCMTAPMTSPGNTAGAPGGAACDLSPDEIDRRVQGELDQISADWTPSRVTAFTAHFIGLLADLTVATAGAFSADVVSQCLHRFRERLQERDHHRERLDRYLKMYREKLALRGGGMTAGAAAAGRAPARYIVVGPEEGMAQGNAADPDQWGIYKVVDGVPRQLANFIVRFDLDKDLGMDIDGELETHEFSGHVMVHGRWSRISITSGVLADSRRLRAAIYGSAGLRAKVYCDPSELALAIQETNNARSCRVTRDWGWDESLTSFRVPSGVISADGFRQPLEGERTVDLGVEERARYLDLFPVQAEQLQMVRRHIVENLLRVQARGVTYSLLAGAALAVLRPAIADLSQRFAIWLLGDSGEGKTFVANLFTRFFARQLPPVGPVTWVSTDNYIERQGHYFKDAYFFVDDYKAGQTKREPVIRVLQGYADNAARGRLDRASSTKTSLPIRGQLLCTGEDLVEQTPSAVARTWVTPVPNGHRNTTAGTACLAVCQYYPAVMADFIRWLLQGTCIGTLSQPMMYFRNRVLELRERYLSDIRGCHNDLRLATNAACMAASFEAFAHYLQDVWPDFAVEVNWFLDEYVPDELASMVSRVHGEQEVELFLDSLRDQIRHGRVRIQDAPAKVAHTDHAPCVGRYRPVPLVPRPAIIELSVRLARQAVTESLQRQGLPELQISHHTLLRKLRERGYLVDAEGRVITTTSGGAGGDEQAHQDGEGTGGSTSGQRRNVIRLDGEVCNVIRLLASTLMPEEERTGPPPPRGTVGVGYRCTEGEQPGDATTTPASDAEGASAAQPTDHSQAALPRQPEPDGHQEPPDGTT